MNSKQKEAAARNIIDALYEAGYIDKREKRGLEYRLDTGDRTVYDRLRVYLIKLATDINNY